MKYIRYTSNYIMSTFLSSSPVPSVSSSSPGKPLTMDDLSSTPHTTLQQSGEAKEVCIYLQCSRNSYILHCIDKHIIINVCHKTGVPTG